MLSVTQATKIAKVSGQAIRKAIKEKRLHAWKVGHQWVILDEELLRWRMMREANRGGG